MTFILLLFDNGVADLIWPSFVMSVFNSLLYFVGERVVALGIIFFTIHALITFWIEEESVGAYGFVLDPVEEVDEFVLVLDPVEEVINNAPLP